MTSCRRQSIVGILFLAALLSGCLRHENDPGEGGVTIGEARELDEIAAELDARPQSPEPPIFENPAAKAPKPQPKSNTAPAVKDQPRQERATGQKPALPEKTSTTPQKKPAAADKKPDDLKNAAPAQKSSSSKTAAKSVTAAKAKQSEAKEAPVKKTLPQADDNKAPTDAASKKSNP